MQGQHTPWRSCAFWVVAGYSVPGRWLRVDDNASKKFAVSPCGACLTGDTIDQMLTDREQGQMI